MSFLAISTVVLCALTLSFAAPQNSSRVDDLDMKGVIEKSRPIKSIGEGKCINQLYIMAFTSGRRYSGSDDAKIILMKVDGIERRRTLPNLPEDDYFPNKGDLWKLDLKHWFGFSGCTTVDEVEEIALINRGTDGWNIESIVTYLVVDRNTYQQSSVDLNVFHWVDDKIANAQKFTLTLTI